MGAMVVVRSRHLQEEDPPWPTPSESSNTSTSTFSGFPSGRRAQIDFVPEDAVAFRAAAKAAKWKLVGPKKAFLVSGSDRPGAVAELMTRLAQAKINVTAADAVCGGGGTFGAIVWVEQRDVAKAAKALGAA